MFEYFISENMKIKHTFVKKLVLIAPLMIIILSVFLTTNYFQVDIYNWWYTSILQGSIALGSSLLFRVDGSMKNKGVMSLPVDLKKIWIAKILVGVQNISISCIIIFIAGQLSIFIIQMDSISNISMISGLWGTLVIIITSIWQIPICFFLSNKIGMFPTIVLSIIVSGFSVITSVNKFWWANPFAYTDRLMCPILKLLPNGLIAKPESQTFTPELLSAWGIPFGILISIMLFIAITYLTAKWYEKQEAK
ncbi:lantibiotic immunity ABC transporter MutE/EpiE family permease subunit [Clostridium saccharobutylicum]|uniref:ABC-2 family transporter protein n=1 Tax=Clostridium saccharobutylicum TaxID=169679 RepID=A0A1S8N2P4_CLOSA|nr:lantibiotic immunity ABC transporter MutE/EpiE family permease subunit [Clostridium saccharobutylicum]OOM10697.1 ABC-2 family transporter protein [Clostridium saccharobutylicum]